MNINKNWSRNEELEFIKELAQGEHINKIALKHSRTATSLDLRLKRIIYENVMAGKKIEHIAKTLKIQPETVRKYFYSYSTYRNKYKDISTLDNIDPLLIHNNMQQNNMQQNNMQHNNMEHNNMQHNNMQHNNMQHNNMQQNNMQQNNMQQNNMQQHNMQQHNMQQNNMQNR
jgi:pentapeptide MXKDX repeat protein